MNFLVGVSGYSYPKWKGKFYPAKIAAKDMLAFYASHFRAVEINATFYGAPKESVLEGWATQVPAEFQFGFKAPQEITHIRRLKDVGDPTANLFKVCGSLDKRLGPLLFQTPPNLKKDLPRLVDFLKLLKPGFRVTMEFRHASWFDDEVFALLRQHHVPLCIADEKDELKVPFLSTADWGYLRLRRDEYDDAALADWAKRMKQEKWKDCYVFFRHEDEGKGPRMALKLLEILG